jgi:DMSO/TMAO reductase YedYZ molybdopterin-dependent catalytic subunit
VILLVALPGVWIFAVSQQASPNLQAMNESLPPGQRARTDFPRFGLTPYACRFPHDTRSAQLQVSGDVLPTTLIQDPLHGLERVEQVSDFHCVTTWSHRAVRWGGVRFADFHARHIAPQLQAASRVTTVVLRGQDGYRTTLLLSDLLAAEVLLADSLNGQPLSVDHGAPLRLVAPAHYGYKSLKHLSRIEFWQATPDLRAAALSFMDHPRARVAHEERGQWFPGWLLRYAYRPLIKRAAARFAEASAEHAARTAPAAE